MQNLLQHDETTLYNLCNAVVHRSYYGCLTPERHFWGTDMQKVVERPAGAPKSRRCFHALLKTGRQHSR